MWKHSAISAHYMHDSISENFAHQLKIPHNHINIHNPQPVLVNHFRAHIKYLYQL